MPTIEIASREYHIHQVLYTEALYYCFSLNINGKTGWRLPTNKELFQNIYSGEYDQYGLVIWAVLDSECVDVAICIPVRDII
jgi:hypothetical protein